MRVTSSIVSVLIFLTLCATAGAQDLVVDPTFNPSLGPDPNNYWIYTVKVQPDQKILVGGSSYANGVSSPLIVRLNPNGSLDPTFNAAVTGVGNAIVRNIQLLPDGKILLNGSFKVGETNTTFVRLNGDGSFDQTVTTYKEYNASITRGLPNGKFIVCLYSPAFAIVNSTVRTYGGAILLNSDGTHDTSFMPYEGYGVSCRDIQPQQDGKFIIAGNYSFLSTRGVHRLNVDGTSDPTFVFSTPYGPTEGRSVEIQQDGKLLIFFRGNINGVPTPTVARFSAGGALETEYANCGSLQDRTLIFSMPDGGSIVSGCRKWSQSSLFQFSRYLPDGTFDASLDRLDFVANSDRSIIGAVDKQADGSYLVAGGFSKINNVLRKDFARLKPDTTPLKPKYDFDGDGKSDLGVFRPGDRYWYLYRSSAGPFYQQFGLSTDVPVSANYDPDEIADIAVFRNGIWYVQSSFWGNYYAYQYGVAGDQPLVADFDNDNLTDYILRRVQNGTVTWMVKRGATYPLSEPETNDIPGEPAASRPIIADFDGDGQDESGYFYNGSWFHRDFGTGAPIKSFQWGLAGDIPVVGDYDGDRRADYAIFRPSTGVWWVNLSGGGYFIVRFGLDGDIPVPADYDGDGKTDVGIYRNGQWWQYRSNGGQVVVWNWGIAGDIPVQAQNQ